MSVLYDYFSAGSDEQAATVIDRLGGPAPTFDTLSAKGIDPVVQLGTLAELLTDRSSEAIDTDPRHGKIVAVRNDGELLVTTITDHLRDALARASAERLAAVAVPWLRTDEFRGTGDPEQLTDFLKDLADLATRAKATNQHLYCWICV